MIEASMGHIIDLPKSRIAVDVGNGFRPEYITVRGRASILNRLKKLAESAQKVLLAADPDREGEAISWHLKNALSIKNDNIKRIQFNEITKKALQQAVQEPRDIDIDLVNAQQARRILDRLVGYNVSPLLWKKVKRGLSAGRVQSIALHQICKREREIEEFVSQEYWTLEAELNSAKGLLKAMLHSINGEKADLRSEEAVKQLISQLETKEFFVKEILVKERRRQPTAPYTTSKLQQAATNKLNFTSQKTMMIAQQLYEGLEVPGAGMTGLITYMRTDSTRVSPAVIEQTRDYIRKNIGEQYLSSHVRLYKSKKSAQDAHEAIRPTNPLLAPEKLQSALSSDQFRLYRMIWGQFIASQMAEEVSLITTIDIAAGEGIFRASGVTVKFSGFTHLAGLYEAKKAKKENRLPKVEKGDKLKLKKFQPEQHFTQPPPRYTDATIIKTLEESGVGRPSTYAPTIQTLLKRYYVTRVQRAFQPNEIGFIVNDIINKHFPRLVDIAFTAQMESELDLIAKSDLHWEEMLRAFYNPFLITVQAAAENIEDMKSALDEPTEYVCDKCGTNMVKRLGRNGYFLACPRFPDCRNARAIPLGPCPKCDSGHVVQRSTRKGRPFFGCENYPECEFSTWDRPAGEKCPQCGKLLFEKSSRRKNQEKFCLSCDYGSERAAG